MASRLALVLVWTLLAMLVQAVALLLPGRAHVQTARFYWRGMAWILGLRITVVGSLPEHCPVLFIANHSSWLDIIALGSVLPGCFVAKSAIKTWPLINWVARLGRTIFVTRNRATVDQEREKLVARLGQGDNIILFPEGTTSDGARVLPFSASFLALADAPSKPFVQPVTIVYDGLDGLPVRRRDRPGIAWYGDMSLAAHYNRLGRRRCVHATIILDTAIAPGVFPNRKVLAAALESRLAHNAAALRQGRDWR